MTTIALQSLPRLIQVRVPDRQHEASFELARGCYDYITSIIGNLVSFETSMSCKAVELFFLRGSCNASNITPGRSTLNHTEHLANEATRLVSLAASLPFESFSLGKNVPHSNDNCSQLLLLA